MADFDFTTLITDRSKSDVDAVLVLLPKITNGTATEEEIEFFNAAAMKGAYSYTDLNRVSSAVYYLDEVLRGYGYVTGVQKIVVPHKGGGVVSRLPEGYTELEYIESSGTQYIDTEFKPNNNTQVVADAQYLNSSGDYPVLFGARTAANSKTYLLMYNPGNIAFRSDYNTVYTQTWSVNLTDRRIFDKDKETTIIDGISQSYTNSAFQCDYNLHIFGLNNAGTAQWFTTAKIYSCQIYDNGTLVRNFIPCINPSGEIGLYDLIGGAFYRNDGTGTFSAGPEVEKAQPIDPEMDDYTWYEPDVPTVSLMAQYLANVFSIYNTILTEPELPEKMANLTVEGANQIEQSLLIVKEAIDRIVEGFSRSNAFSFWSGNRPFPTAYSDRGRTWAELDAMETTWANWQVANWYLLLYGNLEAEGVVE